jgi:predicted GIY-YIG superfamily endonuclease
LAEPPDPFVAAPGTSNRKHWPRKWKLTLIEKHNPQWRGLADDLTI